MQIIFLILILLLCLSFLNSEHFYPWTTYDAEKIIFYLLALIFFYFIIYNKKYIKIDTNILLLILLFFCSLFSYQSYNFKQYFYIFNLYLINLIILSAILKNIYSETEEILDIILIALLISGCISSVFAIYQWMDFAQGSFWLYESNGSRFSANLAQPNHLSTLLLLALLSCLYLFNKLKIALILFFIPVLLFSLVLTQSRSAGLALIFIVIFTILKWKVINCKLKTILFSLMPIYLGMAHLLSKANGRIDVVERANSGFERLAIWQDFFYVFPHLSLFGIGWKNIEFYQFEFGYNFSGYLASYHNLLLDLIVIFGVLGGLFFVYIFFNLLKIFINLKNTNDYIIFLMLFVLINHSLLEFPLFYSYFLFVFCVLYIFLDYKYSLHIFNFEINRFVFNFLIVLIIAVSTFYIYTYEKERSNYRALFLGYCVQGGSKNFLFDEFDNLAVINCKENISLNKIEYFEKGLLSRPSRENILKMIYVYNELGEVNKRDQLLKKYNNRYSPQYTLNDILQKNFF